LGSNGDVVSDTAVLSNAVTKQALPHWSSKILCVWLLHIKNEQRAKITTLIITQTENSKVPNNQSVVVWEQNRPFRKWKIMYWNFQLFRKAVSMYASISGLFGGV